MSQDQESLKFSTTSASTPTTTSTAAKTSDKLDVPGSSEHTIFKTPDGSRKIRNNNGNLVRSSTVSSKSSSKSPVRRHFRNLSGTSNHSITNSASNPNSSRKGINIGISLVGSAPATNKIANDSFKTPRRQLFNKDISIDAQLESPISSHDSRNIIELDEEEPRSSIETNHTDISSIINNSPTPQTNNSNNDELSENFRLLASKEMEILDIKNQLKDLTQRKREREFELQQLKIKIEKQLMFNLKQESNNFNKLPNSPISAKKHIIKSTNSNIDPLIDDSYLPISSSKSTMNESMNKYDNRQSWFSKPLNFIQQFDTLISKELEKLQVQDDDDFEIVDMNHRINDGYHDANKEINAPIKSLATDSNSTSTDVMQSVSQHLWSFVNDVKSNLLIDENEVADHNNSNSSSNTSFISSSSPVKNVNTLSVPKSRVRTASISKRQSYSQHNIHKKRPSMNIVNNSNTSNSGNTTIQATSSTSASSSNNDLENEFTKNNIIDVVNEISKNGNSDVTLNSGNSTTSGKNSKLLDSFVDDSDLWDSEQLDL